MKKTVVSTVALVCAAFLAVAGFVSCAQDDGVSKPASDSGNGNGGGDSSYDDSALNSATLFVVGDSTVCDYGDGETHVDKTYFYPRYGYGTQLSAFLSSKITVKNLALSGRSSKSFILEDNYNELKNSIKAGDFLVIGFGHNDEKSDDADRFSSAEGSVDTAGSFKYNLYNYYVKLALDKGATPILCSPIVRISKTNDYSGANGHYTPTGDYGKAVVDLGSEKDVQVVDLRTLTAELYKKVSYDGAKKFHAIPQGVSDNEPNWDSIDGTHINIYGAKMVASLFAKTIKDSQCVLSPYVKTTDSPTEEKNLVKNPLFKYVAYVSVDWSSYKPAEHFKTTSDGWYGTGFGDCGGDPASSSNGFVATETSAGEFKVGQTGTSSPKGKITSTADGIAFAFRQIPSSRNFKMAADVSVLTVAATNQAGFGLMIRDDCYTPNKVPVSSNYVAAGLYADSTSSAVANFSRESGGLKKSSDTFSPLYAAGETASLSVERIGQVVTVTTVCKGKTCTQTYTDFDFVVRDTDSVYAGFFATRGTTIKVTNIVYEDKGESQGA